MKVIVAEKGLEGGDREGEELSEDMNLKRFKLCPIGYSLVLSNVAECGREAMLPFINMALCAC